MTALRATYRLQFTADFGFRAATDILPYLARLGISHVYASPFLMARPGSSHGYDIVDHNRLNPELGTAADFDAFTSGLKQHGLGLILDFVPNHMGIGGDNAFWRDVLEWGPASDFAGWFDIRWEGSTGEPARLLVPVLGEQFGGALAAGHLRLAYDAERGGFDVVAYDAHVLPLHPGTYGAVLGTRNRALERLGDGFAHLSLHRPHDKDRARILSEQLKAAVAGDPVVAAALEEALARFRGTVGDIASWATLDRLIGRQMWRLADFRVAADDINYRRFFNVNELAGLRMEQPAVFDHAHRFVFSLIARGVLDGLRIDHIDGLYDPKAYCLRLREAAPRPITVHVEKILGPDEVLRADWETDGTTGYEVANLLTGLLIDPAAEPALTAFWRRFTGDRRSFARIVREAKLTILDNELASEVESLAGLALAIAASNPLTRDFTRHGLHRALREILASLAVYRTYVDEEGASDEDRARIHEAVAAAQEANGDIAESVYAFLEGLLTTDAVEEPGSGFSRQAVIAFAMRVQQVSGPVMAKGVEDTAFYRYTRFIAANEVGGEPGRLGVSIDDFHAANARRQAEAPLTLLTTSTHDTKRGEDLRARLAALSGMVGDAVEAMTRLHELLHPGGDSDVEPSDLLMLYQTLIGLWPSGDPSEDAIETLRQRLGEAMLKSIREAKFATRWTRPVEAYERLIDGLVETACASAPIRQLLRSLANRLAPLGAANSLVQTVLKLTIPGVPDIYRGAEGWDFSLVDPDNRRPVDFGEREAALAAVAALGEGPLTADHVVSGLAKTAAIQRLLGLRSRHPLLFAGRYQPLATGDGTTLAFLREGGGQRLLVIARRFAATPVGGAIAVPQARWRHLLTASRVEPGNHPVADLLDDLPAAVLVAGEGA
jgi:(1->4)-alpha-D-glucan 1-alpha-D-glucosylmutase